MKIKRMTAVVLACTLLAGQTVYAQEGDKEEILSGESQEVVEEQEKDVTQEKGEEQEEGRTEQNTEFAAKSDIEAVDLNIYQGYDLVMEVSELAIKVHTSDESVGNIELVEGEWHTCIKLQALKPGNTYVELIDDAENVIEVYHITSASLPEDAVPIEDIVLRSKMVSNTSGVDANRDGYISKEELAKVTYISAGGYAVPGYESIKSLSGLEYAVNLEGLYVADNEELTDIDALFQLNKLEDIILRNTNVSDEDRWKLADFRDVECAKGNSMRLVKGFLFEEEVSVEALENEGIVDVEAAWTSVTGLKEGTARLRISYKNLSKEITVTVKGINYDQEVGEEYKGEVKVNRVSSSSSPNKVLDENGNLWELNPEAKKVAENVKEYLAEWVFSEEVAVWSMDNSTWIEYYLDNNNVLWSEGRRIAENVKSFNARYALDDTGVLRNIFNEGTEEIAGVTTWHTTATGGLFGDTFTYVVKEDGTLWQRPEVVKTKSVNTFEKVDEQVQDVSEKGYLKNGEFILYKDKSVIAKNVKELINYKEETGWHCDCHCDEDYSVYTGFYTEDGNLHLPSYHGGEKEYVEIGNVGKMKNVLYGEECILIQNTENELYKYEKESGTLTHLASGVKELHPAIEYDVSWRDNEAIAAELDNGSFYTREGICVRATEDLPLVVQNGIYYSKCSDYQLIINASGERIVRKRGIDILSDVKKFWGDRDKIFALRTDGTIWDITDVPKMVLDLKTSTYVRGDVNEDGEINIKDLQIILRGVCEKIELTERQIMIADVVEDGKVDIQDLRKELRFVCGKITEL